MTVQYAHPEDFRTDSEPNMKADDNRVQYNFDQLVARRQRTYVFVDYLFEKRPSGLHGAVGTRMRPVHEDELERQKKIYCDQEQSPLYYLYEEQQPLQSWDEWIKSEFKLRGPSVIYDQSYTHQYGDVVKEKADSENVMDRGEIALVECIGGGRMFNEVDETHDVIYDDELYRLVEQAEEDGIGNFYR